MQTLELPELIVKTSEEYERKAVYFGTHPEELQKLRKRVKNQIKLGQFFNSVDYTRKFEKLCHEMIYQWGK